MLKSFIEKPELIDFAIEYIDSSIFGTHKEAFMLILNKQYEQPQILGISLNESIRALPDLESLKEHLRLFIAQAYTRLLAQIPQTKNLSLMRKNDMIRDIKHKILRLKQGELLAYVSISTF